MVLGDWFKTSERCNDVSISLNLERDYLQGEVGIFRVKCQVTKIGMCSQHRDGHWSGSIVFLCCDVDYIFPLRVMTFGSKSNRFTISELEGIWVVISFAARSLGSTKSLQTALMVYIYNNCLLVKF